MDLSIVVLTYNEERRISECLQSLPEGCEVIVLDSHSSDDTVSIARGLGVRVEQHPFKDYADQRNFALSLKQSQNQFSDRCSGTDNGDPTRYNILMP